MRTHEFGNYIIYEDGRVFSKRRNKFLKCHKDINGYHHVGFYENGKLKRYSVHRLVLLLHLAL